ncbi:hypothetical protein BG011_009715 [Mortierella polycephala]|uniref:Uncharacterized protein n=1 Tax=Mortierella polycephala TaxID=41804 RepID=A0A9P6PMW3_9FUNG|nr:hypothetical protein BG011_009715 [Mortierella polycephala]
MASFSTLSAITLLSLALALTAQAAPVVGNESPVLSNESHKDTAGEIPWEKRIDEEESNNPWDSVPEDAIPNGEASWERRSDDEESNNPWD